MRRKNKKKSREEILMNKRECKGKRTGRVIKGFLGDMKERSGLGKVRWQSQVTEMVSIIRRQFV